MPAPHHSVFYMPGVLADVTPTASKHEGSNSLSEALQLTAPYKSTFTYLYVFLRDIIVKLYCVSADNVMITLHFD